MLPDENIEQVRRVKSAKEDKRYHLKVRMSIIGASFGTVLMLFLLLSIWFINDDGKVKWIGGFFKNESLYEASSEVSKDGALKSDELLIIVNSSEKLPEDYSINIKEYEDVKVSDKIYDSLVKMINDAKNEGFNLQILSGYISLEEQEKVYKAIYDKFISSGYSPIKAENEASAYKGGYCEQNTGLSVMFSDMDNFSYTWILENCVKYGFVQRYPENKERETKTDFEPNLFRFVGQENALNMRKLGMCLEEYAEYLSMR